MEIGGAESWGQAATGRCQRIAGKKREDGEAVDVVKRG
jgi:hypothetical protein